jgi:hypothetical protein
MAVASARSLSLLLNAYTTDRNKRDHWVEEIILIEELCRQIREKGLLYLPGILTIQFNVLSIERKFFLDI